MRPPPCAAPPTCCRGNATLLADLADVLAMAQGKRLAGEPARLIQQALDVDPRHVKALALAGSAAFEARDYAAARGYWERVLAVVPADSDDRPLGAGQHRAGDEARGGAEPRRRRPCDRRPPAAARGRRSASSGEVSG